MIRSHHDLKLYSTFVVSVVVVLINFRYLYGGLFNVSTLPLTIFIFLLLISCILFVRIKKTDTLITLFVLVMMTKSSSSVSILLFLMFCKLLVYVPVKLILRINFICMIVGIALAFSFLRLGITKDNLWISEMKEAYAMGFTNPNIFALYVYSFLLVLFYFVKPLCGKIFTYGIVFYLMYLSYIYSGSRTLFLGIFILVISDILISCLKFKKMLYALPVILAGLSIYFCANYADYSELNMLLSGRMEFMGSLMQNLSFLDWLFGFKWDQDVPLDNAYICMLSTGGFVLMLIYMFFYKNYIDSLKSIRSHSLPIILSVLFSGLTEYVFVGLNMISVTIAVVIIQAVKNEKNLSNITCVQR